MNAIDMYESQALRPRGVNVREKLKFLIDWYDKTTKIETTDKYRVRFFHAMNDASSMMKGLLAIEDDSELATHISSIIDILRNKSTNELYVTMEDMRNYLQIELARVIEC